MPTGLLELLYREAMPEDSAACIDLRGKTRENAITEAELARMGITERSWAEGIRRGDRPGHVCTDRGTLVGYCFGDRESGEILVLALLPAFESRGIGKRLLSLVVRDLHRLGHARLFLGSPGDPGTRAYGFYRHLGWRPTGDRDHAGDLILEYEVPANTSSVQAGPTWNAMTFDPPTSP